MGWCLGISSPGYVRTLDETHPATKSTLKTKEKTNTAYHDEVWNLEPYLSIKGLPAQRSPTIQGLWQTRALLFLESPVLLFALLRVAFVVPRGAGGLFLGSWAIGSLPCYIKGRIPVSSEVF